MAEKLNTKKLALTLGILSGLLHTLGVLFISQLMRYWTWVHFITFQYTTQPFSFGIFVVGIITAFLAGAVIGWLFALIYNKLS